MISYVIPTYYRQRYLLMQLGSFEYQVDQDFEVIVTDDGSDLDSEANEMAYGYDATYVWNPRHEQNKYWLTRTVNAGLRVAQGDWLVILTNGCVPARNTTDLVRKLDPRVLYTFTLNDLSEADWDEEEFVKDRLLTQWETNLRPDPRWGRKFNPQGDGYSCWANGGIGTDDRRIRNFWLAGVAMSRELYARLGPLDESYVGYGCEDGAYAASAVRNHGVAIGYNRSLLAHHLPHPPHVADWSKPDPDQAANFAKLTKEFPGIW